MVYIAVSTMQILIWLLAVSHPQKTPSSTVDGLSSWPMFKVMVDHMGETTLFLQLKFLRMSSQSCSVPPVHQKESLRVQMQQSRQSSRVIIRYFTVNNAF